MVANSPLPSQKLTWETIGNHSREKEKPFITEAGPETKIEIFYQMCLFDDLSINQEARVINIAQYQQLVFREFLPALLGHHALDKYNLKLLESGYYQVSL